MKTFLLCLFFCASFLHSLEPYTASYSELTPELYDRQIKSWMEDNPVSVKDLRAITVTYLGLDGQAHQEELVVHQSVAPELIAIFEEIYYAEFPMEEISSFSSRYIRGIEGCFSKHSYGLAVDITPRLNPYIRGDTILPPGSEPFLNRDLDHLGFITENSPCYQAFIKRGWTWGGHWKSLKDYMHFEK